MIIRVATLNLEQDHKCWERRPELITAHLGDLNPDFCGLNEIHVASQAGRWLQKAAIEATETIYSLVQQSKVDIAS